MKKAMCYCAAIVAACAMMTSCASVEGLGVSSNPVGSKKGVSEQFYLAGFALNKGGGIDEAAKDGHITKISHAETRTQSLWPIIGKRKTVVYGE